MIIVPWAMKTIRMVPKIRLSPMAAMPYMVPERMPLTRTWMRILSMVASHPLRPMYARWISGSARSSLPVPVMVTLPVLMTQARSAILKA